MGYGTHIIIILLNIIYLYLLLNIIYCTHDMYGCMYVYNYIYVHRFIYRFFIMYILYIYTIGTYLEGRCRELLYIYPITWLVQRHQAIAIRQLKNHRYSIVDLNSNQPHPHTDAF